MEGHELGALDVPGLDLEPLDPFVDDVFAGMDEHPPGLWHPMLLSTANVQQHSTPASSIPLDAFSDNYTASQPFYDGSQLLAYGHADTSNPMEVTGAQLGGTAQHQQLHQEGHDDSDHPQQLLHQNVISSSSHGSAVPQQMPELHAVAAIPDPELYDSLSSSTLSPVAAADELAASSNSVQLHVDDDAAVASIAAPDDTSSCSTQSSTATSSCTNAGPEETAAGLNDVESAAYATITTKAAAAAAPADTFRMTNSTSSPISSSPTTQQSSSESVPDIDDVSEQQLSAEPSAADTKQHLQQQPGRTSHDQQQLGERAQGSTGISGMLSDIHRSQQQGTQQEGKLQREQYHMGASSPEPAVHDLLEAHWTGSPARQHSLAQQLDHDQLDADEGPRQQLEGSVPTHSHHSMHSSSVGLQSREQVEDSDAGTGVYCLADAVAAPDDPAVPVTVAEPEATPGNDPAAVTGLLASTEAADTPTATGTDDSGEFVSPSSSWHSCMTHNSHMTSASSNTMSHSVMSAASFATARGLPVLSVAARLTQQQQLRLAGPEGSSSANGSASAAAAVECAAAAAAAAAAVAVAAEGLDPRLAAASPLVEAPTELHESGSHPLTAIEPGSPQQRQSLHPQPQQQDFSTQQGQQQQEAANDTDSTLLDEQQQQRWQQELWQDVSPPSLGSSPPTPSGYTTIHPMHMHEVPATAVEPASAADEQQAPGSDGQSCTAAAAANSCLEHPESSDRSPERSSNTGSTLHQQSWAQFGAHQQLGTGPRPGQYAFHGPVANSSYMLRQSELVDLSLSTSVHPSQQMQQQFRPGWLTAHQHLPPAAAQAVERAVSALNDSYFFHERLGQQPSSHQQHNHQQGLAANASRAPILAAAAVGAGSNTHPADATHPAAAGTSSPASGLASSGLLNPGLIGRSAAGHQWSHASTQPQQDQQARHRLPSHISHPAGWSNPGVLGHWFSSTVQQPLTAVASRAAAGVGQRLAAAGIPVPANSSSSRRVLAAAGAGAAGTTSGAGPNNMAATAAAGPPGSNNSGSPAAWDADMSDAVIVERTPDMPQSLQEQEDMAFQGLLFLGGRDSQGRPVVIVNTDAIPAGHNPAPRDAALAYLLKKLSPVVSKGPYVLVMVAFQHGPHFRLLPGMWCVRAYHSLPRAFRKNVKHVVLLQPSLMVRAGLAILYPFVSSKAHAKIKQVHRLLDIEVATSGEVQVPHLGEAFLTTVQQYSRAQQQAAAGQATQGISRTVPVPGALRQS